MKEFYDFLIDNYTIPIYLVTWIVVVLRYRTYYDTPLQYFPIFIMYTFLSEMLAALILRYEEFQFFSDDSYSNYNVIVYNIYALVSFLFYYYIYWHVLKVKKHKAWVLYGAFISILAFMVSLFFQNPFHVSLYYADIISSFILLFSIGLYIKEKRFEQSSYSQIHNTMFWTSMGLAVFYTCFPIVYFIVHEIPKIYLEYPIFQILMIAVVFMYSSFIIGAIAGRRKAFR
ncbi:hypothetical protein [[Muricauda] lutisoli]|uniref:Uncharacterized protein n=1 Tax=[Muricauda] lutisoli TaxID=2816035 RepID=A0ABS3ESE6_9FLAO|nr:hypothetical protein [[Muricauda] lutisoli]MBO0329163.1 hypothetical protein [[Muricauda] lutisoli]